MRAESKKERDFKQKIQENPDSTSARYDYATELLLSDRYDEALIQVDEILKLDPKHKLARGLRTGIEEVKAAPKAERPMKKLNLVSRQLKLLEPEIKEMTEFANALKETPSGKEMARQDSVLKSDYENRYLPLADRQYKQSIQESKDLNGVLFQLELDGKTKEAQEELFRLKAKYPGSAEIQERFIQNAHRRKSWTELKDLVKAGRQSFPNQVSFMIYEDALKDFDHLKSDEQRDAWSTDLAIKRAKWFKVFFDHQMKGLDPQSQAK